ncbi:MAG TPA: tetratricopeptide repeat protein [Bacteroidia bacterium]|nr:tetratricopeptide repeat protein [Bacteroidia bacterium]
MRARIYILLLFLCATVNAYSQSKEIDSLKIVLKNAKYDSTRLRVEISICKLYKGIGDYLQGLDYGIRAVRSAKAMQTSPDTGIAMMGKRGEARSYINIGAIYDDQGNYPQALAYDNKALKLKQALNDKKGIADAYNNIGIVYEEQSNYPIALEYFFKGRTLYMELGLKSGLALAYTNIGIIYMDQDNNDSALAYFSKNLELEIELKYKPGIEGCYNNFGIIYQAKKLYITALDYFLKSLDLRKEENNEDKIAWSYNHIGSIYSDIAMGPDSTRKRFAAKYWPNVAINNVQAELLDSALILYQEAYKITVAVGDQDAIRYSLQNIGTAYLIKGDYKEALTYLYKAGAVAKELNSRKNYYLILEDISKCFEHLGRTDSALVYYKNAMAMKDSVFNEEQQKAMGREEVKYEYEKQKVLDEAENKKAHAVEEEHRKRQQLVIYAAAIGILLLAGFLFFVAQRLRITRKQKSIIELQKEKLGDTLSKLGVANKLLEEKHKDVTDSIQYASRIQTALLTSDKYLSHHLSEYFILFKPKDIVSGDFYWALHHDNKFYLACCDCTGHGVPGAFMSLLNITFLHQSVIEKKIAHPDKIFADVRANVIAALNPDGNDDTKDGMDATLCVFDFEKHMLMASCANNPLFIIRKGELIEFKPDKMPIGLGGYDNNPFTLHETNLHSGDCIYMISDGYSDQFGGPNGKKFKQSQLRELLVKISDKPMAEQKSILDKTFYDWKGDLGQIDDICIIGVRI